MLKSKFIINIAKRALVETVRECFGPTQNEQQFLSLFSKRVGLALRPWGRVTDYNTSDNHSPMDMMLTVLNSRVALNFKMYHNAALLGNSDANYNIWKTVSQLQEFLKQNDFIIGYVCVITPNASLNKNNTFAPIIGSTQRKTRIVMSQGRETLFINNHTIEWYPLREKFQLCIIGLDDCRKG